MLAPWCPAPVSIRPHRFFRPRQSPDLLTGHLVRTGRIELPPSRWQRDTLPLCEARVVGSPRIELGSEAFYRRAGFPDQLPILVAGAGFEPASHGYEPCEETAPPTRDNCAELCISSASFAYIRHNEKLAERAWIRTRETFYSLLVFKTSAFDLTRPPLHGRRGMTRTPNLQVRNPALFPVELRDVISFRTAENISRRSLSR